MRCVGWHHRLKGQSEFKEVLGDSEDREVQCAAQSMGSKELNTTDD